MGHPSRGGRARRASGGGRSSRLTSLRRAIVGADKRTIAAALGPPRATVGVGDFQRDDTWYYPLNPRQQIALAVTFARGVACQTLVVGLGRSALHE